MKIPQFGLAGLALLFATTVFSQAQETPAQAVQRAGAAHGRAAGNIPDSVAEGTLTYYAVNGPKATFDMTLFRKGKTHVQRIVKQGGHELRQGTDGTDSWDSISGQFSTAAQGRTLQFIESQTVRSVDVLLRHQSEGLTLHDRGLAGRARVIEAEDRQGRRTGYSIDGDSNAITRMEFVTTLGSDASGRSASRRDTYVFSDFRPAEGILTPFKIERYSDGIKIEEMRFRSVQYNPALSDAICKR